MRKWWSCVSCELPTARLGKRWIDSHLWSREVSERGNEVGVYEQSIDPIQHSWRKLHKQQCHDNVQPEHAPAVFGKHVHHQVVYCSFGSDLKRAGQDTYHRKMATDGLYQKCPAGIRALMGGSDKLFPQCNKGRR